MTPDLATPGMRTVAAILAVVLGTVCWAVLEGWEILAGCSLGWVMLATTISDVRRYIIPDILSLPMIPAGLLAAGFFGLQPHRDVLAHLVAAAAAAGLLWLVGRGYQALRGREGLGLGDVKLAAVAGAWTGAQGVVSTLLWASLAALVLTGIYGYATGRRFHKGTALPFGAFLAPTIWLVWMLQTVAKG